MNGFYERNNPLASNTIQANYRGRGPGWRTGINTRVKLTATTTWVAFLFLSFFPLPSPPPPPPPPLPLPILRLRSTLIIGDANASLLFQSLSLTARHWRETRRGRLFSIRVNRSRTVSPADRVFLSRHVSTLFVTSTLTQQCNQYFWLVPILFDGKFFFHPKMRRIEFVLRS